MRRVVLEMLANVEITVLVLKCYWTAIRRVLLDSVLLAELALRSDVDAALHRRRHHHRGALVACARA